MLLVYRSFGKGLAAGPTCFIQAYIWKALPTWATFRGFRDCHSRFHKKRTGRSRCLLIAADSNRRRRHQAAACHTLVVYPRCRQAFPLLPSLRAAAAAWCSNPPWDLVLCPPSPCPFAFQVAVQGRASRRSVTGTSPCPPTRDDRLLHEAPPCL